MDDYIFIKNLQTDILEDLNFDYDNFARPLTNKKPLLMFDTYGYPFS